MSSRENTPWMNKSQEVEPFNAPATYFFFSMPGKRLSIQREGGLKRCYKNQVSVDANCLLNFQRCGMGSPDGQCRKHLLQCKLWKKKFSSILIQKLSLVSKASYNYIFPQLLLRECALSCKLMRRAIIKRV